MNLTRLLAGSLHGRRSQAARAGPLTPAPASTGLSRAAAAREASAGLGGRRVARGEVRHVRATAGRVLVHQGLVDLEELRPGGTAGQAEQPNQPPAPRGAGGGDRVVVEL